MNRKEQNEWYEKRRKRRHARRAAIEREAAQEFHQMQKKFLKECEEIQHG